MPNEHEKLYNKNAGISIMEMKERWYVLNGCTGHMKCSLHCSACANI
jgi:hypothetical protein